MLKDEISVQLDKKWLTRIERWTLTGPFLVMLTLILALQNPPQPLWLFSLCYVISYALAFIWTWKGAFCGTIISSIVMYSSMSAWNLWQMALFGSAYLALIIVGLAQEEMHAGLFWFYRDRQSLLTKKAQLEQDSELDQTRHQDMVKGQKVAIEGLTTKNQELLRTQQSLEELIHVQNQNIELLTNDKQMLEDQLFVEKREAHRLEGIIEQLRGSMQRFESVAKQESKEAHLLEEINRLRVEKFELSVLESSHLDEKLQIEQQQKEMKRLYDELMHDFDRLQRASCFQDSTQSAEELTITHNQLKKRFDEKRLQLSEIRKDHFVLEGKNEAMVKFNDLEEWNREMRITSMLSMQNELLQELEEKENEILSLEELLSAGLEGKKDRPRLPPMKKHRPRVRKKAT